MHNRQLKMTRLQKKYNKIKHKIKKITRWKR